MHTASKIAKTILVPSLVVFLTAGHCLAQSEELASSQPGQPKVAEPKSEAKEDFLKNLKEIDAKEDKENEAIENEAPKEPITVYEDEEIEEKEESSTKGIAKVYLTIAVPHTKGPVITLKAYPFPPKPPKDAYHRELPEEDKTIKQALLNSGYMNRTSYDNPFPSGGWRMQYALTKAKKRSNISSPHSILEHYRWADRMIKFIKPDLIAINKYEKKRQERFFKYKTFWSDHHKVLRNKSVRLNLEPMRLRPLPRDPQKIGSNFGAVLPSGNWWIKINYKVKGLAYNWIFSLDLKDKDQIVLVANEGNAINISGGW